MRRLILGAFAGSMLAISAMGEQVIVQVGPPRAVVEVRGRAPHPGWVYQRGYHRWEHRGHDYVFIEGHWR